MVALRRDRRCHILISLVVLCVQFESYLQLSWVLHFVGQLLIHMPRDQILLRRFYSGFYYFGV